MFTVPFRIAREALRDRNFWDHTLIPILMAALWIAGASPAYAAPFPDGTLIRNEAGCVCIVFGGSKQYVCGEVFGKALGNPGDSVRQLSNRDFDAIPTGRPYVPDKSLVRNSKGCIAYVEGNKFRWIPGDVWEWWHPLHGGTVLQLPDDVFNAYPGGDPFRPRKEDCKRIFLELDQDEPQDNSNTCGPNCVARILRYYKKPFTHKQAKEAALDSLDSKLQDKCGLGHKPSTLASLMQRQGLPNAHVETKSSLDRILQLLTQGKPVVALVEDGGSFHLHYVPVQGYDRDKELIYFTDTNGQRESKSFKDFMTVWDWKFGKFGWGNGALSAIGIHGRTIITDGPR
jgi:hypothetical protein